VRAGPERAAGIDDDRERVGGRCFPRRPDPEFPDAYGSVELAPALLPARLDVRDLRAGRRLTFGVRRELELAALLALLEALGIPLDPLGSRLVRARERDTDGDASQRNAFFSLSKKPSCCA
jgi:hypothetical protein